MVEYIPYFAAAIMVIFGIAFYSAMLTFRSMTDEDVEKLPQVPPTGSNPAPDDPRHN